MLARRTLLTCAAALLGAACTGSDRAEPTPSVSPGPDAVALAAAIAREQQLIAIVDQAVSAEPKSTELAEALLRHEVHLQRLLEARGAAPSPDEASPSSPPPSGSRSPSTGARAAVAPAEAAAAAAGLRAVPTLSDPALAALIASIAASEAGSAVVDRGTAG